MSWDRLQACRGVLLYFFFVFLTGILIRVLYEKNRGAVRDSFYF